MEENQHASVTPDKGSTKQFKNLLMNTHQKGTLNKTHYFPQYSLLHDQLIYGMPLLTIPAIMKLPVHIKN